MRKSREREREGGTPPLHTPALPTLRGQALQQFAQALGDLVEVGHTRVGEGHVDAATTPPALVLGIVRGRRLFLALLVPRHIISCGDLRSLKKKIKSAFVTTCLDTHPSVQGLAFVDMKKTNLKSLSQCPNCGHG